MIFVDTNVLMYAVGYEHPLRSDAQQYLEDAVAAGHHLATSAEVLQELLHAYLPAKRLGHLARAWELAHDLSSIWPVEPEDVDHALSLAARHPSLTARDLVHLACCRRRKATDLKTYDKGLAAAWAG